MESSTGDVQFVQASEVKRGIADLKIHRSWLKSIRPNPTKADDRRHRTAGFPSDECLFEDDASAVWTLCWLLQNVIRHAGICAGNPFSLAQAYNHRHGHRLLRAPTTLRKYPDGIRHEYHHFCDGA